MDPEAKKMLEETFSLAQENNKMLHKMRRAQAWSLVWSVLRWVVIIGTAVGAAYILQPYIDKVMALYNSLPTLK